MGTHLFLSQRGLTPPEGPLSPPSPLARGPRGSQSFIKCPQVPVAPALPTFDHNQRRFLAQIHTGMETSVRRRQYSCCDPCRQSKRRCNDTRDTGTGARGRCFNCTRLQLKCTYSFVNRMRPPAPKPMPLPKGRYQLLRPSPEHAKAGDAPVRLLTASARCETDDQSATRISSETERCGLDQMLPLPAAGIGTSLATERDDDFWPDQPLPSTASQTPLPLTDQSFWSPGVALCDPTAALNESFARQSFKTKLVNIFSFTMAATGSSFLSHSCNPFAQGQRYWFIDAPHVDPPVTLEMDLDLQIASIQPQIAQECVNPDLRRPTARPHWIMPHRITMVGIVRLLDRFADLYGNHMSALEDKQASDTLRSAVEVFSMQWLSCCPDDSALEVQEPESPDHLSDSHPPAVLGYSPQISPPRTTTRLVDLYIERWYQTRAQLLEFRSVRSFKLVLAALLFDMTTNPVEPSQYLGPPKAAHEFMDLGLLHLHELENMVEAACAKLSPQGQYPSLLLTSLSIIRWFAYLRDSSASLTSDRACLLPDLNPNPSHLSVQSNPGFLKAVESISGSELNPISVDMSSSARENPLVIDTTVLEICRVATLQLLPVWRHIIKLRTQVDTDPDNCRRGLPVSLDDFESVMQELDSHTNTFDVMMKSIFRRMSTFSTRARMFFGRFSLGLFYFLDSNVHP